jgi:ketosteroid isomerase-like protein
MLQHGVGAVLIAATSSLIRDEAHLHHVMHQSLIDSGTLALARRNPASSRRTGWRPPASKGYAGRGRDRRRPRAMITAAGAGERRTDMAEHPNLTVVREMNEAMDRGDMEGAASRVADDVVWHIIGGEPYHGKAELAASMGFFTEYDIKYDIHDVLASDDHVIALGTATATKDGRSLTYRTAEIFHVRNGQVSERWAFSDDTKAIADFFA